MSEVQNLKADEAEQLLKSEYYGHLACYSDGEIYLVPITYVYENGEIISYTHEGKKINMMRAGATVCVQVEQVAKPDSWMSVICWGDFEEITDHDARQKAALQIAGRFSKIRDQKNAVYFPLLNDIAAIENNEVDLPVLFRITVKKMTGRQWTA